MSRVLPLLGSTVPWALFAQLLLLVVIALILQRQLVRLLTRIVELIHRQKQLTDLSCRLPQGRKDELGRIASAYNELLKTYHQALEDKVRRRTRELDATKRIAERASHRKSEHLASISHEIRTPLNGIVGALSLLERSHLSGPQQELIGTACQSSGFLLSIINNLLDFSRIEAGQLELSYEQTAILPMIDQVLLTINSRAQEKRLSLRTLVAANVPRSMSLDGVRVQQILIDKPASIAPCAWSLKVLVVDDMQVNRDIVGKMLQELGHLDYLLASSGEEALHQGRNHVFDWVLMDIRMPDMDGLQVTRLWRDTANGILDPDTPIMALTANALPAERYRARAAGMNGYLAKPVSLEQLASGVEQVVSLQLARGIDLAPNSKLQQPLLNLADISLRAKLYETLETAHRDIEIACRKQDRASLLMLLHTLKGCAGQGGIDRVYKWAQDQEIRLSLGGWLSGEEVSNLRELILYKTC